MSPTTEVQWYGTSKHSNPFEICDGLTFDFYMRLPHIQLHNTTHNNGEHEEETRNGRSRKQEEECNDGGKWCTYCTHIMTNLHAIVVNSFVFRATPPSHCTVVPVRLFQHGWNGDSGSGLRDCKELNSCEGRHLSGKETKIREVELHENQNQSS